jgi:hypothetical protein
MDSVKTQTKMEAAIFMVSRCNFAMFDIDMRSRENVRESKQLVYWKVDILRLTVSESLLIIGRWIPVQWGFPDIVKGGNPVGGVSKSDLVYMCSGTSCQSGMAEPASRQQGAILEFDWLARVPQIVRLTLRNAILFFMFFFLATLLGTAAVPRGGERESALATTIDEEEGGEGEETNKAVGGGREQGLARTAAAPRVREKMSAVRACTANRHFSLGDLAGKCRFCVQGLLGDIFPFFARILTVSRNFSSPL